MRPACLLLLAVAATSFGFLLGTLGALARRSQIGWLSRAAGIYVEAIRNTPFLIQIFLFYFGFAVLKLPLDPVTVAILALTVNVGAYTSEIMRAGLDAVPRGQIEAGECLGLNRLQIFWHIMLLPSVERVYPALVSQYVLLMLGSSVASQISTEELTAVVNHIQSVTFRAFESYILVALIYVALSFLMRFGFWALGLALFPRRRRLGTPL